MSRGTAADTSSVSSGRTTSCRSPCTPLRHDSVTAGSRVSTTDRDQLHVQATSSDTAVDDDPRRAADADDKEATISSLAVSGSSNDVSDDESRDITDHHHQQLRQRSRDQSQAYPYLDYQAAAAGSRASLPAGGCRRGRHGVWPRGRGIKVDG